MDQQTKPFARLSAEQWQAIIDQQIESGLSQKDYCQSRKISLATFSNWKRKLKNKAVISPQHCEPTPDQDWIELPPDLSDRPVNSTWHMELELPGGIVLRMRR